MPFITTPERVSMAVAYEKGLRRGLLISIRAVLKLKFGEEGWRLMPDIRKLHDNEVLRAVLLTMVKASTPNELRRVWTRRRRPKKGQQTTDQQRAAPLGMTFRLSRPGP